MDKKQVYEVGFLLNPSIAEGAVEEKVSNIKNGLEKAGAIFISEEFPKMRQLAYAISQKTDEARHDVFDRAYFGWIKFELTPEEISSVEVFLKTMKEIIRFLVIKTTREQTISSIVGKSIPVKTEEEQPATTSEEVKEIDDSIDELVIQ